MKFCNTKVNIFLLFVTFPLCMSLTVNSVFAIGMPDYERIQSFTENVSAPTAVAIDTSGSVYLTESSNDRLLVFNTNGENTDILTGLDKPKGVAVDTAGKLYIGNDITMNVSVYDTDLTFLYKLGIGDGEVENPNAIAIDSLGKIYVADRDEDVIKIYNPDGTYKTSFGGPDESVPTPDGKFHSPSAIAIDEIWQEIIVSDLQVIHGQFNTIEGARIQVFDMEGGFKRSFGEFGIEEGMISKPFGVAVDTVGRIYVSDARKHAVQVFDPGGTYLGVVFDLENQMRTPLGITMSNDSKLYIASLNTSSVEVFQIIDILPVPIDIQFFPYYPIIIPLHSPDPSLSGPVGLGPVASGGDRLSITVGLNRFSAPVDIYGAFRRSTSPEFINILNPDGTSFTIMTLDDVLNALSTGIPPAGVQPWMTDVTEFLSEQLFDLSLQGIPPGIYTIYILVAPSGNLDNYYLWETYFVVP
jgi:DNA-binding beta-propeller fold protein YncE